MHAFHVCVVGIAYERTGPVLSIESVGQAAQATEFIDIQHSFPLAFDYKLL